MNSKFKSSILIFDEDKDSDLYKVHNLLRWYGRLPYGLVESLILDYSKEKDTVLANFSGSGTVPFECLRHKRSVVGIETNPVALLLTKVKLQKLYQTSLSIS